jgi:hypothetical protein
MNEKTQGGLEFMLGASMLVASPFFAQEVSDYVTTHAGASYDMLSYVCSESLKYISYAPFVLAGTALSLMGGLRMIRNYESK